MHMNADRKLVEWKPVATEAFPRPEAVIEAGLICLLVRKNCKLNTVMKKFAFDVLFKM